MSNLGHRTLYEYYCLDEDKWITEEKAESIVPTGCINNVSHILKSGSMIEIDKFTRLVAINQTELFTVCDMTGIAANNDYQKLIELTKRVKVLENILEKNGLIKFS